MYFLTKAAGVDTRGMLYKENWIYDTRNNKDLQSARGRRRVLKDCGCTVKTIRISESRFERLLVEKGSRLLVCTGVD